MSYQVKFKISQTSLHWLWRYFGFCGCEDGSGLKVKTPKWTLPKMEVIEYILPFDSNTEQTLTDTQLLKYF